MESNRSRQEGDAALNEMRVLVGLPCESYVLRRLDSKDGSNGVTNIDDPESLKVRRLTCIGMSGFLREQSVVTESDGKTEVSGVFSWGPR